MPNTLTAGTTLRYRRTLSDYPPASWALSVHLAGPKKISATVTEEGDDYVVTFSATATATLTAGLYVWLERATAAAPGTDVFDVASGQLQVLPNVAAAADGDLENPKARMARTLRAYLEGRATGAEAEAIAVYGRSWQSTPTAVLWQILRETEAALALELRGGQPFRTIPVRLKTPEA